MCLMGLMVELTCRTCGHPVYVERKETRGLGKPYVRCANCKAMIILGSRNEWQLKNFGSRSSCVLCKCAPCLVLPLFLVVAVWGGFWLTAKLTGSVNDTALVVASVAVYVIAVAASVRSALKRLKREIAQSKKRMLDADYQHKLKHMHLLK